MAITNGYADLATLKSRLQITGTENDTDLERAIEATSRQIDNVCEQFFYQVSEVRTFVPHGELVLKLGEWNTLVSVTSIDTDDDGDGTYEVSWASSDYQLLTDGGTPNQTAGPEKRPFTQIRAVGAHEFPRPTGGVNRVDLVQVDGMWGWPQIPTAVEEACLILAEETFKLKDAPFGVAGIGIDDTVVRVRDNPKAGRLLSRYMPIGVI